MLRKISFGALLISGVFLFNSCKKQNMCDCFKSRGNTVIEDRTVANFTTLHAYDKLDVYFTQDTTATTSTVKVVTGKHLMSNIITEVVDGELIIKNGNKCNFVRGSHNDVTVYVTTPHIKNYIQDGVGNIFSVNSIKEDSIIVYIRNSGDVHLHANANYVGGHMHGVGDFYVDGVTPYFYSYAVGQGFIHAQDLLAGKADVQYSSNGQAHVNVTGQLNVVISSTGNVYYSGNPGMINASGKGTGKLIHD